MTKSAHLGAAYLLILVSPLPSLAADQTRGFYGSVELGIDHLSAHWPCPPEYPNCGRVDVRSRGASFGAGGGYAFNRFLAIEATAHTSSDGSNSSDAEPNRGVEYSYTDAGAAVRADWPVSRSLRLSAFLRAGAVYESLSAYYAYESDATISLHGFTPQLSGGLSWSIPRSGINLRLSIDRRGSVNTLVSNGFTLGIDFGPRLNR